jgi:hypothetical protein
VDEERISSHLFVVCACQFCFSKLQLIDVILPRPFVMTLALGSRLKLRHDKRSGLGDYPWTQSHPHKCDSVNPNIYKVGSQILNLNFNIPVWSHFNKCSTPNKMVKWLLIGLCDMMKGPFKDHNFSINTS